MIRNLEEKATVVRGLAKEVQARCAAENVLVSTDLCAYLVDVMVMKQEGTTESVVNTCVDCLREEPLSVKTIKLQINWKEKYQTRDEIKRIHHERIFENVLPLMSEITETGSVEKEHFYKKIVIFVIMFAGLGSPTQQSIIKETQAALLSIFKASEMENFLNLAKTTKEQQLVEFARLITGIILFNKDCKKGGEGLDDLPLILTQGARATKERLLSFKDQLVKRIDHLIKGLSQSYSSKEKNDSAQIENRIPELRQENPEKFKTLLTYYTQLKSYTSELLKDLEKSFEIVKDLVQRLQSALLQLHNVVRFRVAVATVQVFPLFVQLSYIWVGMQEEVDVLSEINNNFMDLSFAAKNLLIQIQSLTDLSSFINTLQLQLTLPTPVEFGLPSTGGCSPPDSNEIAYSQDFHPDVKLFHFSELSQQQKLQYEGFCAWSLAHMEGFLIPGDVALGVMQFCNRFYTFSSVQAAQNWALNPTECINTVLKVTTATPELVKFLNLYADLEANFLKSLAAKEDKKPSQVNALIQTDLHPLESNIDNNYTFSEWELRKRSLKLATLTKCLTKSQQTVMRSFFRKEVAVQVSPHVTSGTQTRRDGYSNHPLFPASAWKLGIDLGESSTSFGADHQ